MKIPLWVQFTPFVGVYSAVQAALAAAPGARHDAWRTVFEESVRWFALAAGQKRARLVSELSADFEAAYRAIAARRGWEDR